MTIMHKFWHDENGFILSTEAMLFATILVIGTLVGLAALRGQLVQELGDVGTALGNLNQSYSVADFGVLGEDVFAIGSSFADKSDFCEEGDADGSINGDMSGSAPGGIMYEMQPIDVPGGE